VSLHGDLLAQAGWLARREPRRPKQASLRRAVSTAYYALFHLLLAEATRVLVSGSSLAPLRPVVARTFGHRPMNDACRSFAASNLPAPLGAIVPMPLPAELIETAQAFLDLQEARHQADYDLADRYLREETLAVVGQAERAFTAWQHVRATRQAKVFLVALLTGSQWRR